MGKTNRLLIVVVIFYSLLNLLMADDINWDKTRLNNPFTDFGTNSISCFSGLNSLYHLGGVAATGAIIYSGADYKLHNYFRENSKFEQFSSPAVIVGSFTPLFLGTGLWATGLYNHSSKTYLAGCAVLQATGMAVSYSTILKAITGRPPPLEENYVDDTHSKKFKFGFLNGGVFWGWPSGHMITNTAAVTSLMYYYEDNNWINSLGAVFLGYVAIGIISHGESTMHWTSDVAAGALMGFAIGSTVGKNFRTKLDQAGKNISSETTKLNIMPSLNGISLIYSF